jgi:hypothetical protein
VSRLSDAVAELYSADPDTFVGRRKELAALARREGDAGAAKEITGLAKPTRSAWLVNRLVWSDPSAAARLADLGAQLRGQDAAQDGASIRKLSADRRKLVDALVRQAVDQQGEPPPSASVREEIAETFNAALADPGVADQVAAGAIVRAIQWAGFGPGIGTGFPALSAAADAPAWPGLADRAAPPSQPRSPGKAGGHTQPAREADGADGDHGTHVASGAHDVNRPHATGDVHGAGGVEAGSGARGAAAHAKDRADAAEERKRRAVAAAAEAGRGAQVAAAAHQEQRQAVRILERQLADHQQQLTDAEHAAGQAALELTRAQRAAEQAQRQQDEAKKRLTGTRATLSQAKQDLRTADTQLRQAQTAQRRAGQALNRLAPPSDP